MLQRRSWSYSAYLSLSETSDPSRSRLTQGVISVQWWSEKYAPSSKACPQSYLVYLSYYQPFIDDNHVLLVWRTKSGPNQPTLWQSRTFYYQNTWLHYKETKFRFCLHLSPPNKLLSVIYGILFQKVLAFYLKHVTISNIKSIWRGWSVWEKTQSGYRRSKTLRCCKAANTVRRHDSGESLKWAPKVHETAPYCFLSLRPKDRANTTTELLHSWTIHNRYFTFEYRELS